MSYMNGIVSPVFHAEISACVFFFCKGGWDLIKLTDYLTRRRDIDPSRIGINGISLGGGLREVERNIHMHVRWHI